MKKLSTFKLLFTKEEKRKKKEKKKKRSFFSREISGSMTKRNKGLLSKSIFKIGRYISAFLSHLTARSYGTVLFSFGIISTLMYFLNLSFSDGMLTPIVGIVICVFAMPFLIFDKPLPLVLQKFSLTDYIFYEFFCMKRHSDINGEKRLPFLAAVLLGFLPAILSAFFPLWQVAFAILIMVVVCIGMESPESVFLISLIGLPYFAFFANLDIILIAAVALAAVSFIRKVIYGKRVLFIEQYDVFILLMMIFVLISGIFLKGSESFSDSIKMIVLALGYMLASNIITNRRLAERVINCVVISGCIAAIISIVNLIYVLAVTQHEVDFSSFAYLFARADGMAVFLMISTLFSLGMMRQYRSTNGAIYLIPATLSFIALVISGEFFAVFVLFVASFAYIVLKSNRFTLIFLPALIFAPLLILFIPNDLLNLIFRYSPSIVSAEKLLELWQNSLTVFINNIFFGVGMGSESFAEEMTKLGMTGFPDSSNLFIELGLEAGVFALIALFCLLLTRIRHRSVQHLYVRNSQIKTLVGVSGTCIFCILSFGMVNYIWSSAAAYYLFWCVFGIGSGLLRFSKKDYDDKVLYYEEASAQDSSVIDIEIR